MKNKKILVCMLVIMTAILALQFKQMMDINKLKINNNNEIRQFVNSPDKLSISNAYGDHQAYHPKVLYFEDGWNGFKYWMSFTPYPYADSSKENPHIVVSNDMINWTEKDGYTNPLDEPKDTANGKKYNSDSHLVYNNDTEELECWWRFVDDVNDNVKIYRRTTKDGINWTDKEEIISAKRSEEDYLSPAIIYENGLYKMWYVFECNVFYQQSNDLINWTEKSNMNIEYNDSVKSWHLDVIHTNDKYEMILVAFTNWEERAKMNLYYTESSDNKNWSIAKTILTPTTNTNNWDNSGLYRSSILHINDEYYIFYSGQGTNNAKGIGLVSGDDVFKLKTVEY